MFVSFSVCMLFFLFFCCSCVPFVLLLLASKMVLLLCSFFLLCLLLFFFLLLLLSVTSVAQPTLFQQKSVGNNPFLTWGTCSLRRQKPVKTDRLPVDCLMQALFDLLTCQSSENPIWAFQQLWKRTMIDSKCFNLPPSTKSNKDERTKSTLRQA